MPASVTGTGLPSASPTPSQSLTARRAIALAKTSAPSSSVAVAGSASTARSLRAATISAVVSGAARSRTPWPRSSQRGSVVRSSLSMGQYSSTSLMRVAVHIRPTLVSRAACQSKVACTPCGPAISIRGRGR